MNVELHDPEAVDPTGRAVCELAECGWSTLYHGGITTPGHPIWWGRSWGPNESRDAQCPKCLKGVLRYQPLQTA